MSLMKVSGQQIASVFVRRAVCFSFFIVPDISCDRLRWFWLSVSHNSPCITAVCEGHIGCISLGLEREENSLCITAVYEGQIGCISLRLEHPDGH